MANVPEIEEPDLEVPAAETVVETTEEIEEIAGEEADLPPVEAAEGGEDVTRPSQQTDAFDEMAFIRSVTEDDKQGPDSAKASISC